MKKESVYTSAVRAALAAACLLALAQEPQPPPFRSGVSIVTVDVSVLDADGRPVPGLTAADFDVRLNNRAQPIRGLEYLQSGESMSGAVGPSFDAAPAAPAAKGTIRTAPRVFILLVDDLSFSPLDGKDLLTAAGRFVSSLPPADLVGLTTSTGTTVVNASRERAAILAALPKITGVFQDPRLTAAAAPSASSQDASSPDQSVGIAQALDIERGDASVLKDAIVRECYGGQTTVFDSRSVEQVLGSSACARTLQLNARTTAVQMNALVQRQAQALEQTIRALRATPGIRRLVVLTGGVALSQDIGRMTPVARAAAEAGVQLSVMMATPDISLSDGGRRVPSLASQPRQTDPGAPQRRREDNQLFLNGARTTADMAGGDFYQVTGAPDRFFDRVATAASAVYRMAVEAPADTAPGRAFTLAVRVPKQPKLTLRANRHAVAATAPPATAPPTLAMPAATPPGGLASPEDQMKRAIASGRMLQGLDVTIEHTLRRAADPSQLAIDVVVTLAAAAKPPVNTIFALVDAGGAIRASSGSFASPPDADGYHAAFSVPVAPGTYTLRFAAADASGAVGSVQAAVEANLTKLGPLLASSLRVEKRPGEGRTLLASLELYALTDQGPADVLVKMVLLSPAEQPVVERVVVPESADGILRAEAEFAFDRLPAGTYTLRATVLSGAIVLGTISRAIK